MIAAIHQPQYLPWLGYFEKMLKADVFCYLDTVQFEKNDWQNRNRIRTAAGWQWLTVPVGYRYPQTIAEVPVAAGTWARRHLQALRSSYGRAPYFGRYIPLFEEALRREWTSLCALNLHLLEILRGALGISTPTVRAAEIPAATEPNRRLVDICRALGADTYLAGAGAAAYMDPACFARHGLHVQAQEFRHPVYPQRFDGFVSHLSVVDLLFNCGPESADIIRRAGEGA